MSSRRASTSASVINAGGFECRHFANRSKPDGGVGFFGDRRWLPAGDWRWRVGRSALSTVSPISHILQPRLVRRCLSSNGDQRIGLLAFRPADWNTDVVNGFSSTAVSVCRQPDSVRIWYRSGWVDKRSPVGRTRMDRDLAYTVALYAASMLDRKVCDCKSIADGIAFWQQDLAYDGGATQLARYRTTPAELDGPFGTKRGAVEAWRRVIRICVGRTRAPLVLATPGPLRAEAGSLRVAQTARVPVYVTRAGSKSGVATDSAQLQKRYRQGVSMYIRNEAVKVSLTAATPRPSRAGRPQSPSGAGAAPPGAWRQRCSSARCSASTRRRQERATRC